MKSALSLSFFLIIGLTLVTGQNSTLDSLSRAVETATTDTGKVRAKGRYLSLLRLYKPQKALSEIEALVMSAKKINDLSGYSQAIRIQADCYTLKGDFKRGKSLCLEALRVAEQAKAPRYIAAAYISLGAAYRNLGIMDSSLAVTQQALAVSQQIGDKRGIATAQSNIGLIYQQKGENTAAITLFHEALRLAQAIHDIDRIASIYNNLGLSYDVIGNKTKAIEYYKESMKIRRAMNDSLGIANVLNNIGMIYNALGDEEQALLYHRESLTIKQRLGDKRGEISSLTNIGLAYKNMRRYDAAAKVFRQVLEQSRTTEHRLGIAYAARHLASIFIRNQQWDSVRAYIAIGVATAQAMKSRERLTGMLLIESEYYKGIKQYSKALEIAEQAYATSDSLGNMDFQRQALLLKSEALAHMQRFKEAYDTHVQYSVLKDTMEVRNGREKMLQTEIAYQEEKAKGEIRLREMQFNAARIRNRWIFFSMLFAFGVLGAATIFILRAYKKQQLATQQVQQQNEQISAQAAQLLQLNAIKDRLFSILSHDLRSPLGQLHGTLSLLESGILAPEQQAHIISEISKNTANTLALTENLLFWARSQMEGFHVSPALFNLQDIITDTIGLLYPLAQQKGVVINNSPTSVTDAYADPEMIRLVVRNLISNAIKFCQMGDSITVSVWSDEQLVHIAIEDTGVGISPENLSRLLYGEGYTERGTANEKGTGLGLQLCRDFVRQNGGSLSAESELGRGTIFTITLPRMERSV